MLICAGNDRSVTRYDFRAPQQVGRVRSLVCLEVILHDTGDGMEEQDSGTRALGTDVLLWSGRDSILGGMHGIGQRRKGGRIGGMFQVPSHCHLLSTVAPLSITFLPSDVHLSLLLLIKPSQPIDTLIFLRGFDSDAPTYSSRVSRLFQARPETQEPSGLVQLFGPLEVNREWSHFDISK